MICRASYYIHRVCHCKCSCARKTAVFPHGDSAHHPHAKPIPGERGAAPCAGRGRSAPHGESSSRAVRRGQRGATPANWRRGSPHTDRACAPSVARTHTSSPSRSRSRAFVSRYLLCCLTAADAERRSGLAAGASGFDDDGQRRDRTFAKGDTLAGGYDPGVFVAAGDVPAVLGDIGINASVKIGLRDGRKICPRAELLAGEEAAFGSEVAGAIRVAGGASAAPAAPPSARASNPNIGIMCFVMVSVLPFCGDRTNCIVLVGFRAAINVLTPNHAATWRHPGPWALRPHPRRSVADRGRPLVHVLHILEGST